MKKTYPLISTNPTYCFLFFLFFLFCSSGTFAKASCINAANLNMDIIVKDTVISSRDCYAYDVVLSAYTADLCYTGTTDWTYLLINKDSGDTLQYSWNYDPQPYQGDAGDEIFDKLLNTNDASFKIIHPLEKGNYKVVWNVSNQCGDEASLEQNVQIIDKTPPVPVLKDSYTIILANGLYAFKARAIDKGGCGDGCILSFDNCTSKDELYFTFTPMLPNLWNEPQKWLNQYAQYGKMFFDPITGAISTEPKYFQGKAHAWYPQSRSSELIISCESIAQYQSKIFKIFVWDKFSLSESPGDLNYGVDSIEIYSGLDCLDNYLTGTVLAYKNNGPVPDFLINVTHGEGINTALTEDNGNYEVEYPNTGFTVEAFKEIGSLNGITTLDLVLIQKYLLGLKKITDPYCIIATDISGDGRTTAFDILELRRIILGIKPFYRSWIGIKKGYVFQDPLNPFKELDKAKKYEFQNEDLNRNDLTADFTGVKIGEMSCDFIPPRNDIKFDLVAEDIIIEKGKRTEIPIYAKNAITLEGMQLSLDLTCFSDVSIESGKIKISQVDYNIKDNIFLLSFTDATGLNINENDILFTLIVETDKDTQLSTILKFAENSLIPEVYSDGGSKISDFQIEFRGTEFNVFEPVPNPFYEKTYIDFQLTEEVNYSFTILDLSSRPIFEINGQGKKGLNTVKLTKDNFKSGGFYLFNLNAGKNHKSGKLIFLNK
jgi:hypothetical protein